MEKRTIEQWKARKAVGRRIEVLGMLGMIAALIWFAVKFTGLVGESVLFGEEGIRPIAWLCVILTVSVILGISGSSIRMKATLELCRALSPGKWNIAKISQFLGDTPAMARGYIVSFSIKGKLDAKLVERDVVVIGAEPDEAPAGEKAPPPPKKVPAGPVAVQCSGCGATTTLKPGESAECEYCGSMLSAK